VKEKSFSFNCLADSIKIRKEIIFTDLQLRFINERLFLEGSAKRARVLQQGVHIGESHSDFGYVYPLITYDKVGNRKTKADNSGTANYTYDTLNRLVQATNPIPTNPLENFTYDAVGNRVDSNQNGLSTFNAANQLEEDAGFNYLYDANGNLVQKTDKSTLLSTVYEYDAENKLVRVSSLDKTVNYKYDGLGRRIEKEVTETAVTNVTQYIYDNEDILLELDGSNNIIARYTHGPGIDEPLIMEKSGMSSFYHTDALGSIMELTDNFGVVVQSYTYSSFGKIESQQDPNFIQPYTFIARELDLETNLYHIRARYYDSSTGRFIQEDLLPGHRSLPQSLNLYPYVVNNPAIFIDSDGENPYVIGGFIAVGVGVYFVWRRIVDKFVPEIERTLEAKKKVDPADLDNFVPDQQKFQLEFAKMSKTGGKTAFDIVTAAKTSIEGITSIFNFCITKISEAILGSRTEENTNAEKSSTPR